MIIRRIVGGVLAAGAIASGVGILASPTAGAAESVRQALPMSKAPSLAYMNRRTGQIVLNTGCRSATDGAMARADAASCFG